MLTRRVAVTGLGAVTGFGSGMAALWQGLCDGRTSIRPITRFDASGFPTNLAAEVADFSAKDYVPKHYRKAVKVMARDIELAVAAAKEAVESAKLTTRGTLAEDSAEATTYRPQRMGCHIGAGLISAEADELTAALSRASGPEGFSLSAWGSGGMENLTPLWMLKYLPNMLSCHVTIIHDCRGPSNTITCAEASGLLSVAESCRVIERDDADLCFTGGAESKVNLMGMLRMDYAHRIATVAAGTDPASIVRPYDKAASGGILGEGAGIVVLEAMETARARGAPIYAELLGCGAAHSPYRGALAGAAPTASELAHWDAPDEGFAYAIENAMSDAGCQPSEIDLLVLQGSGVPTIDGGELGALRQVFGPSLSKLRVATLAPAIGNCMAGAAGLLFAVAAKAIAEQRAPARLHSGTPAQDIDAGACESRAMPLRRVLVASSSLGGQNAAAVLGWAEN